MCKDYLISMKNEILDRLSSGLVWRIVVNGTQKVMNTCKDRTRYTLCKRKIMQSITCTYNPIFKSLHMF